MEALTTNESKSMRILANRAILDANEIYASVNNLALALIRVQTVNIKHDIGVERINEIVFMFMDARDELVDNARELRSRL